MTNYVNHKRVTRRGMSISISIIWICLKSPGVGTVHPNIFGGISNRTG